MGKYPFHTFSYSSKVTVRNIAIALITIYLLMGIAIYRANMPQNNKKISTTTVRAMEEIFIFAQGNSLPN
jgi:hypothetical protein